jgi:hypothetical protein
MNRRLAFAGTARNVNGSDDSEQCDKKNLHGSSDHQWCRQQKRFGLMQS